MRIAQTEWSWVSADYCSVIGSNGVAHLEASAFRPQAWTLSVWGQIRPTEEENQLVAGHRNSGAVKAARHIPAAQRSAGPSQSAKSARWFMILHRGGKNMTPVLLTTLESVQTFPLIKSSNTCQVNGIRKISTHIRTFSKMYTPNIIVRFSSHMLKHGIFFSTFSLNEATWWLEPAAGRLLTVCC